VVRHVVSYLLSEFFGVDGENITIHVSGQLFFFFLTEPTITMSVSIDIEEKYTPQHTIIAGASVLHVLEPAAVISNYCRVGKRIQKIDSKLITRK